MLSAHRSAGPSLDDLLMRIFILVLCFITFKAHTQSSQTELGFGLGAMNYTGDLTQSIRPGFFRPGATAHFRININEALSLKAAITGGRVFGSDLNNPVDSFAVRREAEFGIYLFEFSGVAEYHFLKWKQNLYVRWTPYIFAGLGLAAITGNQVRGDYSSIQPVIPIGIGAKYILNPRHMLEFQFGLRKTFFDYLDGVSEADLSTRNFQSGNWYDNDMYYFVGVAFTFSFYDIPCPKLPY